MEDEFKSPNQSDELNLPEQPNRDESIEQFEQGESVEDIDQIESIVEPEQDMGQKIDVVRPTRPVEPVRADFVENVEPVAAEPIKPIENVPLVSKVEVKKPAKKSFAKKLLAIIVVLALMIGSAAAAYWWRDKQANEFQKDQAEAAQALQQQVADLTADLDGTIDYIVDNGDTSTYCDDRECLPVAPAQSVLDNIKGVITTANTQPLEGYMADSPSVITINLESVSSSSSNGAMSSVTSFLESSSRVWDFNLSDLEVDSYKAGEYGQYFDDATIIGKSADGEVIAITFDCNSKINEILVSTSEDSVH